MKWISRFIPAGLLSALAIDIACAVEAGPLQRADDIGEIFQKLEYEIPHISGLEERSLIVPCDGKMYSVAQLGWWTKRVIPRDEASREVVWRYTESHSAAVRYIAFCAIFESFGLSFDLLPESISIFHSTKDMNSEK